MNQRKRAKHLTNERATIVSYLPFLNSRHLLKTFNHERKKDITEIKPYSTTGKAPARVVSSLSYRPMTLDLTKLGLHKNERSYRLKLVVLYIDKKPSKALDAIFTND